MYERLLEEGRATEEEKYLIRMTLCDELEEHADGKSFIIYIFGVSFVYIYCSVALAVVVE
jgi:hypothetical protein